MSALADRRMRSALGRKGGYEASWVFESEITGSAIRNKMPSPTPTSPVTIYSTDVAPPELILLPDAWTTVGKNGRPLKHQDLRMYDEPVKTKKSKKKKKRKTRHSLMSEEDKDPLSDLAEASSSSTVVTMLDHSIAVHAKEVSRGLDKKYWVRRNKIKRATARKNASLLAALLLDDDGENVDDDGTPTTIKSFYPLTMMAAHEPVRNFTTLAQKKRRASRLASAAARCYAVDDEEEAAALLVSKEDKSDAPMPLGKKSSQQPRMKTIKKASASADAPSMMSDKRKVEVGAAAPQSTARKSAKKQSRPANCSCS